MGAKKLDKFGGMLPAWSQTLIPDGQAVTASNCYLFSGELNGWRVPTLLRNLTNSAAKFAYRLPTVTQALAQAFLVFLANPVPGDTVILGEITYTFTNSSAAILGTVGYYVLIGGSPTATATNFLHAVTWDNGQGTNQGITYSFNTTANVAIATLNEVPGSNNGVVNTAFGPATQVIAPDYGAAFNNIQVAESTSTARMEWINNASTLTPATSFAGGTNPTFDSTITGPSAWLEFLDPDTNVVKSQVVNDAFKRFYFASPSVQPMYNTTNRINAGLPAFDLGINPPQCAPGLTITGGGNLGTLGLTTSIGGASVANANFVYLYPVVPTGAIQIDDVTIVGGAANNTANWQTVVFADVNEGVGSAPTAPGTFLNASPTVTGWAVGQNVGTFANPSFLTQGVVYWIGFMTDTAVAVEQGDATTPMYGFSNTFTNGFPVQAPPTIQVSPNTQANFQMWMDFETSDVIEARSYVYTWISAYGEESAPSPFTLLNGWTNATWTVTLFPPPADDLGILRNLAVARIYRTVTGTSGLTTYYQVADVSLGSTDPDAVLFVAADTGCLPPSNTYVDTTADNVIAIQTQLPSTNFFPPPTDLLGFVGMPNGVIAAWKANEIWFCEPYFPHAWPPGNVVAVDFPIVGLGVTVGALVATTSAYAYVVTGTTPGTMNLFKCPKPEPCTSRGSMVSLESGVYYTSPNGLIVVPNTGQLRNITQSWIKKEDWDALVPQKNTRAIALATTYFSWGTTNGADTSVAQVGFNIALDTDDSSSFTIWPQPGGHRLGFMPMISPLNYNIDNLFTDPWTGQGVLIMNGQVYWYDFTNANPIIQTYNWKSKKYREVARKNYSALRVFCTVPASTPAQNPGRNEKPAYDPSWNTLQSGQWGIIKVWADPNTTDFDGRMVLVMARELRKNGQIMRLPDGYKAENWQVEVLARVTISNIQIGTSVDELGEV